MSLDDFVHIDVRTLSSLNPLVVTPTAAAERSDELATGLFGSFTLGAGQFCTKPGVAFVPEGADGDALVDGLVSRASAAQSRVLVEGVTSAFTATPSVLSIDAISLTAAATEEAFGPLVLVVRYRDIADVSNA